MLELADFQVVAPLALRELGEHGLGIDAAHQFADVLALPHLSAVRGQPAQVPQGDEKVVRQSQAP